MPAISWTSAEVARARLAYLIRCDGRPLSHLAGAARISRAEVYAILDGSRSPTLRVVGALLETMGLSWADLDADG